MSLLAAAIALADLCRPVSPAASPDPGESAAYTAVGDDARAAGDPATAAIAYRKAVTLDPSNERAAAGLAALCHEDSAASLLDAIARYRAGDQAAAAAALADIVRAQDAAAGAHFFLGLIALERHDTSAAIHELELASADPRYGALAVPLLRLAHRDGALAVALLIEPELDTNPQLVPDTPPTGATVGAPSTDEDLLTVPYLRFGITAIAMFLIAQLLGVSTLGSAAMTAMLPGMPYQRGQFWVRRFRQQAERLCAALAALATPPPAPQFVSQALLMLQSIGWIAAHRFLFTDLRVHLLGWPAFLAPDGRIVALRPAAPPA